MVMSIVKIYEHGEGRGKGTDGSVEITRW